MLQLHSFANTFAECFLIRIRSSHAAWIPEKRVPEDVIESPTKLEFKMVKQNHSGIYSCTSSNTTIVKITLFVGGLPRVPGNIHVKPSLDEHEYSILDIRWDGNSNADETEYVLEILNREETRNWTRVARIGKCCKMEYEHVGSARTAQVRLAAVNKYGSSKYTGALNFTWTPQARLEVYFDLPAEFAGKEILYNIAIHKGSPDEKAKNEMFTSLERRILIKEKLNHFDRYYIRLKYETTGNDSLSGSTDLFYVRTAEGIPGQVRNLKLSGSKTNLHTKEYAVFPITWDEPSVKKGQIIGYKIRWKLSKSLFDIFFVEQCGNSYEIKVFSHNERYKAFISAKTIAGYGAETELAFDVGSPPDWKYKGPVGDKPSGKPEGKGKTEKDGKGGQKSTQVNGTLTADRIMFEAQLRKKIGHEYGIGHARILISACTLMIATMFAWFLKYTLLEGRVTSDIKVRKTKGILQQARRKPKGNDTKKRKKV
ncbi:hypothetical protein Y032_0507g2691 [Ancylostoma ceylanicum]|uniref:Fibronectin type-III domain-containing protein n=2 Tax=Ancylostoma ceylanicum TaxID=53326 RepID=A0A016WTM4_9BILA|nr:hypothetical protein Y032_0507g2691 [Ancylostoma ceylanicum]